MEDVLFKSVDQETDYTELKVTGKIPSWLEGSLVRNGPGKFELGDSQLRHWFDGFAILHKFDIKDGKVFYRSKFLKSEDYEKNLKVGKIKSRHFGTVTDPCANIFSKFFSSFKRPNPNNANVSVVKKGNKIAAVSDFSSMVEFDYETLETKGRVEFKDKFGNGYMFSASHPSYDPETDEVFNCVGEPGPIGRFHFYKLDDNMQRQFIGYVKAPKSTYFHSFALTKKYFIFIEQPLQLNLFKLIFGRLLNVPYSGSYKWKPESGNTFYLMNRETGEIKSFKSKSFFFFHSINAFDDNDNVVVDLCIYDSPEIIQRLYLDKLKNEGIPHEEMSNVARVTIDVTSGKVEIRTLDEERLDLPTINFNRLCKTYRYVYGFGYRKDSPLKFNNQLIKIDIETGRNLFWYHPDQVPSEPLFVESPHPASEDDGVVLTIVLDRVKNTSFLLILDAMNFEEIGRAEAPINLPVGLHGMFYNQRPN